MGVYGVNMSLYKEWTWVYLQGENGYIQSEH